MGISTHHIHLTSCQSTQTYLKENYLKYQCFSPNVLISTDSQTNGHGRSDNSWSTFANSLAFSFSLVPSPELSLTPLEIAVHLVDYFQNFHHVDLQLKWPNDLMTNDQRKCGGILCHNSGGDYIFAGVGINLGNFENKDYQFKTKPGQVLTDKTLSGEEKKLFPQKIYQYILSSRLTPPEIIKKWNDCCCHIDKHVLIGEINNLKEGKFLKIGDRGEAILKIRDKETPIFSGSLFLN